MLRRVKAFAGVLPLAGITAFSCSVIQEETPPNFVIILFDDLGWDDLGVNGNSIIETPNIDAFAAQSAQFSNFYVNPVCAASRASLLTGRHFLRTGVSHVHGGKDFLALDEVTIADVFQQNGYKTAMWGKWHSGDAERYYPWQRGFEEALSLQLYKHRDALGFFNGEPIVSNSWADELIVDYAIDFMDRNKHQPFFAFVSLLAPHTPLVAPDHVVQKYIDKGLSINFATLYAMIDFADQELGRLFNSMDGMGLTGNTLVMILSDNGPAVNRAEISDEDRAIRYVNGYRGHKGDIWENGVKSPLFVRWPDKIKPSAVDALTDITDIFPGLLDIAGIQYNPVKPLDGRSFASFMENGVAEKSRYIYNYSNKGWPPSLIPYNPDGNYNEYQPVDKSTMQARDQVISVRTQQYKLLLNPGIDGDFKTADSIVLVDMLADPMETANLASSKPDITHALLDSITHWYNGVLMEPTSYAPPVLYLYPDKPTLLKATWVSDLSDNLLNTVTAVKRWQEQDGWVEYQVVSPSDAVYEARFSFNGDITAQPRASLSVAETVVSATFDVTAKQWKAIIALPQGESTVRFSVMPGITNKYTDELIELEFVRLGQ